MTISFALPSKKRVHVVIEDYAIRYVESTKADLHSIKSLGEKLLPPGMIKDGKIMDREGFALILQQCVDEWKIKHRKVYFLVPDAYVVVRKVEVPLELKEEEIRGYLYMEIGSQIHLPFEEPVLDIVLLDQEVEHRNVLLIAAPQPLVEEYSKLFEEVKLKPVVADISPLAIYRLYHRLGYAKEDDQLLCLEVDVHAANISIFHQDRLFFFRHITLNVEGWSVAEDEEGAIHWQWQAELEQFHGEIQDLLAEVERVMNFYHFSVTRGRDAVNRILLTGSHPFLDEIHRRLKVTNDLPLDFLSVEKITTGDNKPISYRYYSLLGSSLREVN